MTHENGLRIFLYTTTAPAVGGGVQTVFKHLADDLRHRGHTVYEAWPRDGQAARPTGEVHPLVYPVSGGNVPVPHRMLTAATSIARLALALRRLRPDIVNVHFLKPQANYFLWLRRLFGYRLVLSGHGSDVLLPRYEQLLHRYVDEAEAVTVVTPALAHRMADRPRSNRSKIHVIPNGVDHGFWSKGVSHRRLQAPPTRIVSVGRLHHVKGHDVLLRALPRLRQVVPDLSLSIVGDGPRRAELQGLTARLEVEDLVTFTGAVDRERLRSLLGQSDLFVLPSRSEGMPLSVLEAMSAGLPVVATAVGGLPHLLGDGCGRIVPPDDPAAMADTIADVLAHPDQAAALARRGRRDAKRYPLSDVAAAYEDLFYRIVARSAGPGDSPSRCVRQHQREHGSAPFP